MTTWMHELAAADLAAGNYPDDELEPTTLACGCQVIGPGPDAYPFIQCAQSTALGEQAMTAESARNQHPRGSGIRALNRAVKAYWAHFQKEV